MAFAKRLQSAISQEPALQLTLEANRSAAVAAGSSRCIIYDNHKPDGSSTGPYALLSGAHAEVELLRDRAAKANLGMVTAPSSGLDNVAELTWGSHRLTHLTPRTSNLTPSRLRHKIHHEFSVPQWSNDDEEIEGGSEEYKDAGDERYVSHVQNYAFACTHSPSEMCSGTFALCRHMGSRLAWAAIVGEQRNSGASDAATAPSCLGVAKRARSPAGVDSSRLTNCSPPQSDDKDDELGYLTPLDGSSHRPVSTPSPKVEPEEVDSDAIDSASLNGSPLTK